ncbi:MAG: hypothetical protein AAGF87_11585 [Bacteroidota bacterium]
MDTAATKDLLHLRIEQADEKLLAVLAELTESLFRNYQPNVAEAKETEAAPSWAKPMTAEESLTDLREGLADYEAGNYLTLKDASKEAATW